MSQEKDQLREVCAREHKECELLQIKVQQMELYHTRYTQEQTDRHRMEVEELHVKIGKLQEVCGACGAPASVCDSDAHVRPR